MEFSNSPSSSGASPSSTSPSGVSSASRLSGNSDNSLLTRIQDKVGHIYYKHGLLCSKHPYILVFLTLLVTGFSCYPIIGIHYLIGSSSQPFVTTLDDLNNFAHHGKGFTASDEQMPLPSSLDPQKVPRWVSFVFTQISFVQSSF